MKNQKRLQVNNKKSTIFEIKSDSKQAIAKLKKSGINVNVYDG